MLVVWLHVATTWRNLAKLLQVTYVYSTVDLIILLYSIVTNYNRCLHTAAT